jgi:hypothetical protein
MLKATHWQLCTCISAESRGQREEAEDCEQRAIRGKQKAKEKHRAECKEQRAENREWESSESGGH